MASKAPAEIQDPLSAPVRAAAEALANGEFVLLFDEEGREEETDLMIAARHTTPAAVRRLRNDGGGLVFVAVGNAPATTWQLPFAHDIQAAAAGQYPLLAELTPKKLPYDARSSFSLWINHRDTYTGIIDRDRSLTITSLAQLHDETRHLDGEEGDAGRKAFARQYRAPGHVPLCVAHPQGLTARQGHTELVVALAEIAGIEPFVAGCEMLAEDADTARTRADAEKYARQHGHAFLTGKELKEAYTEWKKKRDTQNA